jgi:Na+-driven multidrug efflux pump
MLISVLTQWTLLLPAVWLVGPTLRLGLTAIWIAQVSYRLVQTALFVREIRGSAWRTHRV